MKTTTTVPRRRAFTAGRIGAAGLAVLSMVLTGALGAVAGPAVAEPTWVGHHAGVTLSHGDAGDLIPLRAGPGLLPSNTVRGHDVSYWQGDVDWADAAAKGARFVYIKATEDDDYISSRYEGQWVGAASANLYRGSYHFARPFWSDGASQARYFLASIHGWAPGERILPPMVDLEHRCTDLTQPWAIKRCRAMTTADNIQWIRAFVTVIEQETGVKPVIYTNPSWWREYTGNTAEFSSYPLFLARWRDQTASGPGALPGGWSTWTFWQHWDDAGDYRGPGELLPGDQDLFNGTEADLQRFADAPPAIDPPAAASLPAL